MAARPDTAMTTPGEPIMNDHAAKEQPMKEVQTGTTVARTMTTDTPLTTRTAEPLAADKASLRRDMLRRRNALTPDLAAANAEAAQAALLAHPLWQSAGQVVLYVSVRNELGTARLIEAAWNTGKQVLLPRCDPTCTGSMCLAPCLCHADLAPGSHGIPEPSPERCPTLDQTAPGFAPDLAVIPGVAFDRTGNRLGYGGGYYDRFLAGPGMARATLIGFAHAFQIVDALPAEPWDRPVVALCSEEGLIWL